jgi:hypothetical protein
MAGPLISGLSISQTPRSLEVFIWSLELRVIESHLYTVIQAEWHEQFVCKSEMYTVIQAEWHKQFVCKSEMYTVIQTQLGYAYVSANVVAKPWAQSNFRAL